MSKKLHVVSLGCTKNLVDTEVMLARLPEYEITQIPEEADLIIVNTCGFIGPAKEESLQTVFDLHSRRKKDSTLVMAGCLSERYKEELQKEMPEVDIFTGVGDYAKIDELISQKKSSFSDQVYLIRSEERIITGSNYHAYIKLSEGCNQQCSFCAIPSFKGKLQSRPIEDIVQEIKNLVAKGYKDFTFVSQDSSSYLRDFGIQESLVDLIHAVEEIEGIMSARILYLYPSTTTPKMIDAIANSPVFVNYFEMPIQHISDSLLKKMKRGIGAQKTKELLYAMRAVPESFLRTSLIVGHPGESEEDFHELVEFLEDFEFDRINLFAYSDEEGTKAYEMEEKIPQEVIEERLAILDAIVKKQQMKSLEKDLGKTVECYLDGTSEESELLLSGRKKIWAPEVDGEILINDSEIDNLQIGNLYKVHINERLGDKLVGTVRA
ncbi:30S ribosomal protein S12 methylthiotransferase RimO [Nitratiruptor sp. SB155-2]|uniref:Ribosomal protein uS12 methylthiotransferase RimO n=1 Tax=Nitratiruptor sp. (strain SB155-2) TaxID=387092 RepID=RIMO_NITSB|nr:30S ribosomal protein S12 methylthiotransferase RimO [Nitratiruptor sp. SB155-2]A6Q526.1 RecName: Full=Ribosomal protein uS12 methylthiotransferase RimO; Short=uS12 MTTase; Short=uS12 methylthiotransferase; AltName: Full=Ribosomal protein uS12 (aspartate-C(3))-methylthiotransferase; AltName: Full=Ribosome maturation factor RimO [Nitratiruptor sp. SB155-2]BAF70585.1 tRNA modifying enzyme [Nitratiruptor sp. SB155-2]